MRVHYWITAAVALGCAAGLRADLMPLAVALNGAEGGAAPGTPRHGVPDYVNETTSQGFFFPWAFEVGDDIHRTTSLDIVAVDIGYFSQAGRPIDVTLRIYENTGDFDRLPPPLIAVYTFPGMHGEGLTFVLLDLPEPLEPIPKPSNAMCPGHASNGFLDESARRQAEKHPEQGKGIASMHRPQSC